MYKNLFGTDEQVMEWVKNNPEEIAKIVSATARMYASPAFQESLYKVASEIGCGRSIALDAFNRQVGAATGSPMNTKGAAWAWLEELETLAATMAKSTELMEESQRRIQAKLQTMNASDVISFRGYKDSDGPDQVH